MKTGRTFLKSMPDECKVSVCPGCKKDCGRIALVHLVYTWEVCDCGLVTYQHLTPTIWHKSCYLKHNQKNEGGQVNEVVEKLPDGYFDKCQYKPSV